ncbi:MAG: PKD domain-containing protein [Candidatus Nanoarchaeia archaeon]
MTKENINHRKYSRRVFLISLLIFIAAASIYTNADLDSEIVLIENISSYVLDSSVIVYWDTNILADSLIKYGLSSDNLSEEDYLGVHSYAHASELLGLQPNAVYYFVVNSTNANGNSNESQIQSFTTLQDITNPSYESVLVREFDVNSSGEYNSSTEDNSSVEYASLIEYNYSMNNYYESTYDSNRVYVFSANWIDNGIMRDVMLQNNFSGNISEYNMTKIIGTNNYEYSVNSLSAGSYFWRIKGTDVANNSNTTEEYIYTLNKAAPIMQLYLDGNRQNLIVEEKSAVNITGVLVAGDMGLKVTVSNSTEVINESIGVETVSFIQFFEHPGLYNITISYNESENYTSEVEQLIINVTPIELNIFIDKPEYVLGESLSYLVIAPNSSNLSMEICGPLPVGSGFVECKTLISSLQSEYPYAGFASFTNKSGAYKIRAQINYKGLVKIVEKNYTVNNNLQLSVSGDLMLKMGQESELVAVATGGVGSLRYNWTLSNGTKITGQNLNVKYNSAGSYPVILTVMDDYGNYKMETRTLVIKRYYVIKVVVLDNENGGDLSGAKVKMESDQEITNSDGEASFELMEGDYYMKVGSSSYVSYSETITANSNKTLTVKLSKAPANTYEPIEISLISPVNNWIASSSQVTFEANIDLAANDDATCWFYVSEDDSDWYRIMKTVQVKDSGKIAHTEAFSSGSTFEWKVQCESDSKTYASKVLMFNAQNYQEEEQAMLTIIDNSLGQTIDAGELRRRIESAITNIDSLDMESKRDAESLGATALIDKGLKDYERAMRDINNIIYRRDLSTTEQEVKKLEYYSMLRVVENATPLEIRNLGYQTFISYPSKEDLASISGDYQKQKNILGRINEDRLTELQNGLIVTTRISNVEITYLNGRKEIITLVAKTLKIIDNSTDTFLLESIPKEFAGSSDELFLLSDVIVVNKDPLLKLDKQDKLVYYVLGQKDLELGKSVKTMLLSDSQFSTRNSITGDVTLSSVEWTSPTSLIILIALISCIYLLYAFDVFGALFEKSRNKLNEERINKILNLIKDAKDLLQLSKITQADLLFKEIKLMYEDSSEEVRREVYQEAMVLLELIDSSQVEILISGAQKIGSISDEERMDAEKSRELLKKAYELFSDSLKIRYYDKINLVFRASGEQQREEKKESNG